MTDQRIPSSTLDKYYRVNAPREERGSGPKNEIRISQKSDRVGQYIMYAINLFLKDNEESVIIKAAGNAAVKCVLVAEILRHRIPDLHQINKITQTEIQDLYKPKEEGLDPVTITKVLPVLEIKLTTKPTSQELNDPSYQKPLPAEEVEKVDLENPRPVRKFPQNDSNYRPRDGDEERPRYGQRGGRRGGNRYRRGGPRGGPREDQREDREDFRQERAPKDFEPENFRRGAPQQRGGDDRRDDRRRDDDYNRGAPQRGGYSYRGGRGDRDRDNRGGRDNYQGERDFKGGNRGGYRGDRGFNDRKYDDREEDRGFRGGNRGYGNRRDDYEERRYDDREERGDERPRGGFRGGRGGRGGFRGSGFRGGFRGGRGGNF